MRCFNCSIRAIVSNCRWFDANCDDVSFMDFDEEAEVYTDGTLNEVRADSGAADVLVKSGIARGEIPCAVIYCANSADVDGSCKFVFAAENYMKIYSWNLIYLFIKNLL